MGWLGLIFLFILLSQSEGARNEPKELQLFGLAPHLFNPSNPAQRLMLKKNLENCHAPICQIAQKYFSSDLESVNKNSLSQRRAEVVNENATANSTEAPKENTTTTPATVKKCDNCQGPDCNCKFGHILFPFQNMCEKNGVGSAPDFMVSAICWIMGHEKSFRIIAVEIASLIADLMKLLPFGDMLPVSFFTDLLLPPAPNTPKPPGPSNPFNTPEYPSHQPNSPNYPQPPSSPNFPNPFNPPGPQNVPNYPQPPNRPEPMSPPNTPNRPNYPQPPSIQNILNPQSPPSYPQPPSPPNSLNPPSRPNYPQQPNAPNSPNSPIQSSYPQPQNAPNSQNYPSYPQPPSASNPSNYPSAPSQNYPNYPQNPVAPSYPSAPSYNQQFNPLSPSRQPGAPTAPNQDGPNPFSAFRPFFSRS